MNYELALELYKNGFPQDGIYEDGRENFVIDDDNIPEEDWIIFLNPTLSELIEACGEAFDGLWLPPEDMGGKVVWIATPKWDWRKMVHNKEHQIKAPTPEEAVARLWLALNKK